MKVRDEVCGMTIEEDRAAGTVKFQGKTYFFCSDHCRSKFEADSDQYAVASADGDSADHDHHHHHHH